jgi:hypothetical protein
MNLKNLRAAFLIFFLFFCFHKQARATHLYGGELTYEYIGPSGNPTNPFQYRIIYKIYRGINSGSMVNFKFYQKSGTVISTTLINNPGGLPVSVGPNGIMAAPTSDVGPIPLILPLRVALLPACLLSGFGLTIIE